LAVAVQKASTAQRAATAQRTASVWAVSAGAVRRAVTTWQRSRDMALSSGFSAMACNTMYELGVQPQEILPQQGTPPRVGAAQLNRALLLCGKCTCESRLGNAPISGGERPLKGRGTRRGCTQHQALGQQPCRQNGQPTEKKTGRNKACACDCQALSGM